MATRSEMICDGCKKSSVDHEFYWYRLTSRGFMDWDQIARDFCTIGCLKEWADKDHCRANPERLGGVITAP